MSYKMNELNGLSVALLFGIAAVAGGCSGEPGEAAEGADEGDQAVQEGTPGEAAAGDGAYGEGDGDAEAEEETRAVRVPAGTTFEVTLQEELSTQNSQVGDRFTVTTASVLRADGVEAVPAGAELTGSVTAVQHSESAGKPAVIKVDFSEIHVDGRTYPVDASVTQANPEVESRTSTAEGAAKVGAGAAAGAILGRIIGGDSEGTLIGAAVGAAAGTAIVLGTQDADAVLPEGSNMTLRLDEPLQVEVPTTTASR